MIIFTVLRWQNNIVFRTFGKDYFQFSPCWSTGRYSMSRKMKTMICVPRFDFPPLIVAVHANHWNIQNAFHGINTPSSLCGTTVSWINEFMDLSVVYCSVFVYRMDGRYDPPPPKPKPHHPHSGRWDGISVPYSFPAGHTPTQWGITGFSTTQYVHCPLYCMCFTYTYFHGVRRTFLPQFGQVHLIIATQRPVDWGEQTVVGMRHQHGEITLWILRCNAHRSQPRIPSVAGHYTEPPCAQARIQLSKQTDGLGASY